MRQLYKILFIFLCTTSIAQAEVESWYSYWSIGIAEHTHPSELDAIFDAFELIPGVERTEIALDMLGFYWPLENKQTILGVVVSSSADNLSVGAAEVQLNQYLYGVSAMHFFGKEPGDGVFLRGDIGMSKIVVQATDSPDLSSDNGTGYLVGAGYGFPVSNESRLIFGVSYSSNSIENDTFTSTHFTIGGLW